MAEMRRAIAMLVDQKSIVDQIYEGVDQVATSILLPSSWAYAASVRQPSFDVEGARKLLADCRAVLADTPSFDTAALEALIQSFVQTQGIALGVNTGRAQG